jgi:GNAT superfamily N-acetyltransferase
MLDYTLVTTKATYRLVTPVDLPGLIALATSCSREERRGAATPDRIISTVRELNRHKLKGSVLVFEKDEVLVGYCILIPFWSNERGGTIISVDELYVAPAHRGDGLEEDFIALLQKVAPQDCVGIQIELVRGARKRAEAYRKLGFHESDRSVMTGGVGGS